MDETLSASQQREEFKRCADSFEYFCETYVKITHPKNGLVPFKLYDFQKRYLAELNSDKRYVIGKKFCNGGFTTVSVLWLLWRAIFKRGERIMVGSKKDREAMECCWIARQALESLPRWLVPPPSRCNDHEIKFAESDSTLWFHAFTAACGRKLTHLYIDEPAFIPDMEEKWKALYPAIACGGRCIAMSTPNGKRGWFYETLTAALRGGNEFSVFTAEYWEHPDYDCPEWVASMKENLGERGWRQEVLTEFLDDPEEDRQEKEEEKEDNDFFYFAASAQEEQEILRKCRRRASRQGIVQPLGPSGGVGHNNAEPVLVGAKDCHPWDDSDQAHCGILFEHMQRPPTFRGYWWADVAEEMAEEHIFVYDDHALEQCVETKKTNLRELEERLTEEVANTIGTDDMLVLAGLITEEEHNDLGTDALAFDEVADREVLAEVKKIGGFPDDLKLAFTGKKLCLNGVRTNINEFDLCCLYNGLLGFYSHDAAVRKVARLIWKRMAPLFGTRKGSR